MSLTHALKWSFLSELASKAISPIVFIVLARLLTPEDFGVMSAALMVMGFSQIFWEAGMGKALIQRQTDTQEAANVAFWVNIGLSIVISSLLLIAAGPIARTFFHDERVTAVIQVMTLQVFLGAVSSVHTALLQKDMGFKKLFWVRFATVSLPGMASIPLALGGMGYWALVAGTLVGQLVQVLMLWKTSHWRPKLRFDTRVAKEMGRFGAWVGASGLLAWFYVWADSLIVGMYLGSHELGLYRTGNQVAIMIYAIIFGPIVPVIYSYFSKLAKKKETLALALEKIIHITVFIGIPVGLLGYSLSSEIEHLVFGEKWKGLDYILGMLTLMHGVAWIVGFNGEAYRAMGKPSIETLVMGISLPLYIFVYIIAIKGGMHDFVIARFGAMLTGLIMQFTILKIVFAINITKITIFAIKISAITLAAILIANYTIVSNASDNLVKTIAHLCLCVTSCILMLYIVEKKGLIKEMQILIQNRN